jgi:DNA end-binding protein Ku
LATTLRTRGEVVSIAAALSGTSAEKPNKQMTEIARKIIEQKVGPFDPDEFTDRYEDALRALIEDKRHGHQITRVAEPKDTDNVVDLMDALRKSLRTKQEPESKSATIKNLPKAKARR